MLSENTLESIDWLKKEVLWEAKGILETHIMEVGN